MQGQLDEAITNLQKALDLKPGDVDFLNNLGNALLQKGQRDDAVLEFQKALALQPNDADIHNNLGSALLQNADLDGAITQFQAGLALDPNNATAHNDLAAALFQKGQTDEAIKHFQQAIALSPDYVNARINLGNALLQQGQLDDAAVQFQDVLAAHASSSPALNGLSGIAWRRATSSNALLRDGAKAVRLARQADQLTGGSNPQIAAILAAAYAEAGQFPQAITTVQRALQLAADPNNSALIDVLQSQLKSYQAGRPLRDPGT
jgi:Flp pilus assembly protein TadD